MIAQHADGSNFAGGTGSDLAAHRDDITDVDLQLFANYGCYSDPFFAGIETLIFSDNLEDVNFFETDPDLANSATNVYLGFGKFIVGAGNGALTIMGDECRFGDSAVGLSLDGGLLLSAMQGHYDGQFSSVITGGQQGRSQLNQLLETVDSATDAGSVVKTGFGVGYDFGTGTLSYATDPGFQYHTVNYEYVWADERLLGGATYTKVTGTHNLGWEVDDSSINAHAASRVTDDLLVSTGLSHFQGDDDTRANTGRSPARFNNVGIVYGNTDLGYFAGNYEWQERTSTNAAASGTRTNEFEISKFGLSYTYLPSDFRSVQVAHEVTKGVRTRLSDSFETESFDRNIGITFGLYH
ncbi:hypothetical protein [Yoonia sp.]|uniref:hypothetical protein n=1 Tax=Yoonia sp. TaxID=2212373 RepID=UPI003F6D917B